MANKLFCDFCNTEIRTLEEFCKYEMTEPCREPELQNYWSKDVCCRCMIKIKSFIAGLGKR